MTYISTEELAFYIALVSSPYDLAPILLSSCTEAKESLLLHNCYFNLLMDTSLSTFDTSDTVKLGVLLITRFCAEKLCEYLLNGVGVLYDLSSKKSWVSDV